MAMQPELDNIAPADPIIRIALYTQQPFVAQGLAAAFRQHSDLQLAACPDSLPGVLRCLQSLRPDLLLVHPVSGISLSDLSEIRSADSRCRVVLWADELGGEFAFQAMQLGVRGILRNTTPIHDFLAALRNINRGALCFERDLLENVLSQKRVALSLRQGQIVSLVAQGLKNKEIAFSMGITEGTVKVYLYKLFKKLGLNDRLDMALYGRRNLFTGPPGLERLRNTAPPGQFAGKPVVPRSVLLVARKYPGASAVN
jgi:DNA-binding NarL/FixJ family response regulator